LPHIWVVRHMQEDKPDKNSEIEPDENHLVFRLLEKEDESSVALKSLLGKISESLEIQIRTLEVITTKNDTLIRQNEEAASDEDRRSMFERLSQKVRGEEGGGLQEKIDGLWSSVSQGASNLRETILGEALGSVLGRGISGLIGIVKIIGGIAIAAPVISGFLDNLTNGRFSENVAKLGEIVLDMSNGNLNSMGAIGSIISVIRGRGSDSAEITDDGILQQIPKIPNLEMSEESFNNTTSGIGTTAFRQIIGGPIKALKNATGAVLEEQIRKLSGIDLSDTLADALQFLLGGYRISDSVADFTTSLITNGLLYKTAEKLISLPFKLISSGVGAAIARSVGNLVAMAGGKAVLSSGLLGGAAKYIGGAAGLAGLAASFAVVPTAPPGDGSMSNVYAEEFEKDNPRPDNNADMGDWIARRNAHIEQRFKEQGVDGDLTKSEIDFLEKIGKEIRTLEIDIAAINQLLEEYDDVAGKVERFNAAIEDKERRGQEVPDVFIEKRNEFEQELAMLDTLKEILEEKTESFNKLMELYQGIQTRSVPIQNIPEMIESTRPKTPPTPKIEELSSVRTIERLLPASQRATKEGSVASIIAAMMPSITKNTGSSVNNVRHGDNIYITSLPEIQHKAHTLGGGFSTKFS
jgi:hypothetical protein